MKKLLIFIFLNSKIFAQTTAPYFTKADYFHLYAGTGIAMGTGAIVNYYTQKPGLSSFIGFATGTAVGVVKEVFYDRCLGHGVYSLNDIFNTTWGAAVGGLVIRCVIDFNQARNPTPFDAYVKQKKRKKFNKKKYSLKKNGLVK